MNNSSIASYDAHGTIGNPSDITPFRKPPRDRVWLTYQHKDKFPTSMFKLANSKCPPESQAMVIAC